MSLLLIEARKWHFQVWHFLELIIGSTLADLILEVTLISVYQIIIKCLFNCFTIQDQYQTRKVQVLKVCLLNFKEMFD